MHWLEDATKEEIRIIIDHLMISHIPKSGFNNADVDAYLLGQILNNIILPEHVVDDIDIITLNGPRYQTVLDDTKNGINNYIILDDDLTSRKVLDIVLKAIPHYIVIDDDLTSRNI